MRGIVKTFDIEVKERREDGGRIVISTADVDRDRDRVLSDGAQVQNYLKNPVVQFGHNYREPWATIGRTRSLEIKPDRIEAEFDLRPAANEQDPQNIVKLLWQGDWIRTASIGFNPDREQMVENEHGGFDFQQWELLEWSLVPVPANQSAIALMAKSLGDEPEGTKTVHVDCEFCGKEEEYSHTLALETLLFRRPIACMRCVKIVEQFVTTGEGGEQGDLESPSERLSEPTEPERDEPEAEQATPPTDESLDTNDDIEPDYDEDALAEALTPLVDILGELIS